MSKSLCRGKRTQPNKCIKLRGCKVAKGPKRTFCRKKKSRRTGKAKTMKKARTAKRRM